MAFVESHRTTLAHAVYHRSSTDGGKTWTEAKNLSEDLPGPGIDVGRCQILADSRNRVYVIWRAGLAEGWTVNLDCPQARGTRTPPVSSPSAPQAPPGMP